jgi:Tfp pilus assembly protein PilX
MGFDDRALGRPRKGQQGSVLVMTVVLLGTLMVLTASFLRLGVNLSHEHNSDVDDSRAFCIAEAGVSEASAAILSGKSGNVGSQAAPASFANGMLWVVATDLGGSNFQLDSTALCDSGRAAVRAVVHQDFNIEYTQGVTSDQPLVVGSNFQIDSYDPAKGSYASQPKVKLPGHNDLFVGT